MRAALAALAVLGVAGLAGQVTYEYRDLAAARFPQARPVLEQACALLGCRIEAAHAIGALAVESSGLVRVETVSYTHLRAPETVLDIVCRLLLEKKKHPQILTTMDVKSIYHLQAEF